MSDNISVLYKFRVHVLRELLLKFGKAKSVCQMKQFIREFSLSFRYFSLVSYSQKRGQVKLLYKDMY